MKKNVIKSIFLGVCLFVCLNYGFFFYNEFCMKTLSYVVGCIIIVKGIGNTKIGKDTALFIRGGGMVFQT